MTIEKEEMKAIRTHERELEVLRTLAEIKKRLVDRDCSPLHRESEALYQTMWSVIGEYYGWNREEDNSQEDNSQEEDLEDTEDSEAEKESQDQSRDRASKEEGKPS